MPLKIYNFLQHILQIYQIVYSKVQILNHQSYLDMQDSLLEGRHRQATSLTNFELIIQRPKTYRNVNHLTLVIAGLSLAPFYFGLCLAYLTSVSPETLQKYFNINHNNINTMTGYLISCLPIGAIFGAISAPFTMTYLSRKKFILVMNLIAIVLAGVMQVNNLILLFVAKVVQGFIIGNYMAITPIYINQLVPVDIQGSFGAFTQIFAVTGIVICYAIGVIFSVTNVEPQITWRFLFSFPGLFPIIQSILFITNFIPESPVSLVQQGRISQAREVLLMFNTPDVLDKVMRQATARGNHSNAVGQKQSNSNQIPLIAKAIFLGFQLPFMQQMSGINTINTEIGIIVGQYDKSLILYAPLIATFVQMISSFLSAAALTYFGRRTLLLFGNFSLAIIDILIAILFILAPSWPPAIYIIMSLLTIYMFIFGITIGPVVWLYVPEIIPARLVPPATAFNWIGCTLCVLVTPLISDATNSAAPVFFIFGGLSLLFSGVNYFLVVETKGLSLLEISKKMAQ